METFIDSEQSWKVGRHVEGHQCLLQVRHSVSAERYDYKEAYQVFVPKFSMVFFFRLKQEFDSRIS